MLRRYFSSRLKNSELAVHLRRLYKRIHPDVLHRFPKERAVNEESFQRLQAALDETFSEDTESARRPPIFSSSSLLSFYYRIDSSVSNSPETPTIRKISVPLHRANVGSTLTELFRILNLGSFPTHLVRRGWRRADKQADPSNPGGQVSVTLRSLFANARNHAFRWKEREHVDRDSNKVSQWVKDDETIEVLSLQRSRGISIRFDSTLPRKRGYILAVRRLSAALQRCKERSIAGLRLLVNGGFDVRLHSPSFTLFLGICAREEAWDRVLKSDAVCSTAAERRLLAEQEREAARHIGIAHLLYDSHGNLANAQSESDHESYRHIVQHFMTCQMAEKGDDVTDLSVVVFGDFSAGSKKGTADRNNKEGILRVGVSIGSEGIARLIQSLGPDIVRRYREHRLLEHESNRYIYRARRALHLDGLRRGDGITDHEWRQGLADLVQDARRLRSISACSRLVIGSHTAILDSGEIQIPWNYNAVVPF